MTKTVFEEEDLKRVRDEERHFGEGHDKGLQVTLYDFEPLYTWSAMWLHERHRADRCYHCKQRPPDRLICLQRGCRRQEIAEAGLWEVDKI